MKKFLIGKMNVFTEDSHSPLVSVHYPGVVKNVGNMLESLGGIKVISSVYSEQNRRLELRFRPDDAFCKPAFASRKSVVALLLKVKIKKKKGIKERILSYEPVGYVTEEFKFNNMCDFQYLPTSENECLYNSVVPKDLDTDWLSTEASLFLPPAIFSRTDTVQNFNFTKNLGEEDKLNVIGRLKRKRYGCTKCLTFENPEVPTVPKDVPHGLCATKIIAKETLEHLKTERPIYSKSAIKGISKLSLIQLKCVLPCVAYYFINGPWRSLWVRFGYDPRRDPSSRIYQTLDYRVRSHLSKDEVKSKRGTTGSTMSHKFSNQSGKITSVIQRNIVVANEKIEKSDEEDYIFRPEMIPPSRQCYYQYCDIHVPEVKTMLENLEAVNENAVCHEIDGWMPSAFADTCRDIMNRYVCEEVKRRSKMFNQPTSSMIVENQNILFYGSESDYSDTEQL